MKKQLAGFSPPANPRPIDPAAAERFELGGEPGPDPKRPVRSARSSKRRRAGTEVERTSILIPPALMQDVRIACAKNRRSLSDAAEEAFADWIKKVSD